MNEDHRPDAADDRDRDDRLVADLEQLDQRLAEEQGDGHDVTIDSELHDAKNVLDWINRVRRGESDTDRKSRKDFGSATQETLDSDRSSRVTGNETAFVNQRIGPYVIEQQIARGGMGIVFRARDLQLGRSVALKMMLAGPFAYEDERRRFRVEAEAAAQLDHPGIVPVYDVGEHAGQLYFTMGLVDGESLSHRIRQEPMAARTAAELARQIAAAVQYAHGQGVIHRDVKPANVLLDASDRARITDFGLARRTDSVSDLTGTEQVLGTPSYMAPEQASGQAAAAGPLADVYAIGATLYCMITGRPPFQAPSAAETLRMVIEQEPVAPRQLSPAIPVDLNTVCLKCLQKEPHRRYQSAAELEADLTRFLHREPIEARPVGAVERTWKWSRRHPLVAGLSAAIAAALVAIIFGGLWYQGQLNQTLDELKISRTEAVDQLYRSLTGEAQYLTEVRPLGYGPRVETLIEEARQLDSPAKNVDGLRQLAVSGLGYVGARSPITLPEVDGLVRSANVQRSAGQLIVGLDSGDLVTLDLQSKEKLQQLKVLDVPVVRIDVDTQNQGEDGNWIRVVGQFAAQIAEVTFDEQGLMQLRTRREPIMPEGFLGIEVTPDGRSVIGVQPVPAEMAVRDQWITPSTLVPAVDVGAGRRLPADSEPVHFAVRSLVDEAIPVRQLPAVMRPRFDVDDRFLVAGSSWIDDPNVDDEIVVYDHHTGEVVQTLNTTCGSLLNVRISPAGRYIAAGSHFGFEVFERFSGTLLLRNDEVGACTIESFVGREGDVLVRTRGELLWFAAGHPQPLARFARDAEGSRWKTSSDGRYLIATATNAPRIVDTRGDGRLRIAAHSKNAKSVSFSRDGRLIVSSTIYYGGNLSKVWDAGTGELMFEFVGAESTFSPNGKWIACWDGGLKLWDVATGSLITSAPCESFPQSIRFSPSGNRIAAASLFDGEFDVWQIDSAETDGGPVHLRHLFTDSEARFPIAWSPSGERIAYGHRKQIRVHELASDRPIATLDPEENLAVDSLGFLDERRLLVIADRIQLWDVADQTRLRISDHRHLPPLVFAPGKEYMLCRRTLIRTSDLSVIFELPAWLGGVVAGDWSADGRRIAYGLDRGDVTIWDLPAVQASLESQGLPWEDFRFALQADDPAVTAMTRLGKRHSGHYDPQQWEYRFQNLTDQLNRKFDHQWVVRETNWLAGRLDRIASRPFFEPRSNDDGILQRLRDVNNLARELQNHKEYDAEQSILKAMQRVYQELEFPTAEMTRQASQLYHISGDLHNFFQPDGQRCLDAYAAEEKLIEHLIDHPDEPQPRASLATSLFWLNRNLALAQQRFGAPDQAISRMETALGIAEEFSGLQVDPSTIENAYPTLAGWLEASGRAADAEKVRQRAHRSGP